jgi:ABC-type amino acid transport substrate-binding protein
MRIRLIRALVPAIALALASGPALAGETMDRIVNEKNIRLGIRSDAPPFASVVDGQPQGFSVDLCGLIAGAIMTTSKIENMTGKFVEVTAEDRFEKLAAGEIDVLCGATTATLTRRAVMSFSIPIFSTGVSAVVAANAPDLLKEILVKGGPAAMSHAAIAEAFKGRKLGVRAGTTAEDWLIGGPLPKIEGVTVVPVEDHAAGLAAVAAGELDAYFGDKAILIAQRHASDKAEELLISRNTFTSEPYALAMPRDDEALRLAIDRALSHIYRSGAIYQVFSKHFGKVGPEVVFFYSVMALPE